MVEIIKTVYTFMNLIYSKFSIWWSEIISQNLIIRHVKFVFCKKLLSDTCAWINPYYILDSQKRKIEI